MMERLRLAALGGDAMAAPPILSPSGAESWRQKESKVTDGVPDSWGDHEERAIAWEEMTAVTLLNAGVDIVTLRHPKAIALIKETIDKLMST